MDNFFQKIKLVFSDPVLRGRVIFTILALGLFRVLASIPIPGVDIDALSKFLSNNQFFGLLNIFSGGGLNNLSIVMLGVGPYITASIIMQLLTMMFPKLKAMYQEEGEAGRKKFSQYSRLISIPLSIIQSLSFIVLLEKQGIIFDLTTFDLIINVAVITAGSVLLMWLGELVTEFGIGNGVSLIIFAGIVSQVPQGIAQALFSFDQSKLIAYAVFAIISLFIVAAVVFITEAERPIPITYAKRVRGNKVYGGISTYLPLRLNQAGVIPIIFALSLLLLPQLVVNLLKGFITGEGFQNFADIVIGWFSNQIIYGIIYFLLVFIFTYFYTAVTFDPHQISENLQKNGAFIPGVRPGQSTSDYIGKVLGRITMVGALFLGFIAVLPIIVQGATGITSVAVGGTSLLIVVSVVLDLVKKVDAQLSMREY